MKNILNTLMTKFRFTFLLIIFFVKCLAPDKDLSKTNKVVKIGNTGTVQSQSTSNNSFESIYEENKKKLTLQTDEIDAKVISKIEKILKNINNLTTINKNDHQIHSIKKNIQYYFTKLSLKNAFLYLKKINDFKLLKDPFFEILLNHYNDKEKKEFAKKFINICLEHKNPFYALKTSLEIKDDELTKNIIEKVSKNGQKDYIHLFNIINILSIYDKINFGKELILEFFKIIKEDSVSYQKLMEITKQAKIPEFIEKYFYKVLLDKLINTYRNEKKEYILDIILSICKHELKDNQKYEEYFNKKMEKISRDLKKIKKEIENILNKKIDKNQILKILNFYSNRFIIENRSLDKNLEFLKYIIAKLDKKFEDDKDIIISLFKIYKKINDEKKAIEYYKMLLKKIQYKPQVILNIYNRLFRGERSIFGYRKAELKDENQKFLKVTIDTIPKNDKNKDGLYNLQYLYYQKSNNWKSLYSLVSNKLKELYNLKNTKRKNEIILESELDLLEILNKINSIDEIDKQTKKIIELIKNISKKDNIILYNKIILKIFKSYLNIGDLDTAIHFFSNNIKYLDTRSIQRLYQILNDDKIKENFKGFKKMKQIYLLILNQLKNNKLLNFNDLALKINTSLENFKKNTKDKNEFEKIKNQYFYKQKTQENQINESYFRLYYLFIEQFYKEASKHNNLDINIIDLTKKFDLTCKLSFLNQFNTLLKNDPKQLKDYYKYCLAELNSTKDYQMDSILKFKQIILEYLKNN